MRSLLIPRARGSSYIGRAPLPPGKHLRVLAGIDSLTAGGGDPQWSTYLDTLRPLLQARYGNGGPGLIWADALSPGYFSSAGSGGGTAGAFLHTNPSWTTGARSHTLCGLGTAFAGVTGGALGLDPGQPWDICRLYFELSAGASFGIVANGSGALAETVNATKFPTGTLCCVDIRPTSSGDTGITAYSVTGTLNIFAADFLREAAG